MEEYVPLGQMLPPAINSPLEIALQQLQPNISIFNLHRRTYMHLHA